jgi:hypothetical protein
MLLSVRQGPGGHDSISGVSFMVILFPKQSISCINRFFDTFQVM